LHFLKHSFPKTTTDGGITIDFKVINSSPQLLDGKENAYSSMRPNPEPVSNVTDFDWHPAKLPLLKVTIEDGTAIEGQDPKYR
jgi:hypothetical protein